MVPSLQIVPSRRAETCARAAGVEVNFSGEHWSVGGITLADSGQNESV
jgi:hypothetical protein